MTVHFSHSRACGLAASDTDNVLLFIRGARPCAKPYYAQATEGRGRCVRLAVCVCVPLAAVGTALWQ